MKQDHVTVAARFFKTAWFAKAAMKAHITDTELCKAIHQIAQWQADDLSSGVYKKRLNNNMHRSIIVAKGGRYWFYAYLFAKQDRGNIEDDALFNFRVLAKAYSGLTDVQLTQLLLEKDLMEICHDHQA